jgi:hypothetical protein
MAPQHIWQIGKKKLPPDPDIDYFERPNGPSPPQNTSDKVGASPPPLPLGFWGEKKPLGPPKATISGSRGERFSIYFQNLNCFVTAMAPNHTLGCLIMLPVPGPGFQGRFGAGVGPKAGANKSKSGPKLPGPKAGAVRDRILVRWRQPYGRHKTTPGSPAPGPKALVSKPKYKLKWFGDGHGPMPDPNGPQIAYFYMVWRQPWTQTM